MITVGVVFGSSELGLSEEEVQALTISEKEAAISKVTKRLMEAGAIT